MFISAAETDRIDIISIIFDNISNIEYCLGRGLLEASKRGHYETANYLLNRGADVNALGGSAVHIALANQNDIMAKLLIERGALVGPNWVVQAQHLA